ncbi:hypothetical protein FRB94_014570 [Tulasnella sp. JGI-2019a]|nr:hypothetical protein FRB94_014570 [Tulasnella sp. JGI-2019a]
MRPSSYPDVSGASPALQGRLKIVGEEFIGYVARQMSMLDEYQMYPKDIEKALIVQIPSEDQQGYPHWNIELISPIPWDFECKYLGIVDRDASFGKETFLVQYTPDGPPASSECAVARAWGIRERRELYTSRTAEDHSLRVLYAGFTRKYGSYRLRFSEYTAGAELIFEPI